VVYDDPLLSIINKIKADSDVRSLLPAYNNVFNSHISDTADIPSIFVYRDRYEESPILTFNKSLNPILLSKNSGWKLISLHDLSIEHSKNLGYAACNSVLPSIVEAGLYSLKYSYEGSSKDENFAYPVYRSDFTIYCITQRISI